MSRRCPQCGTEYPDDIAFCGHDGVITIQVPASGDPPDPRLGQRYGDYIVVARVADGAMGRVYEGRHAQTKQRVAVKVLHDDVAKDRVAVERFKREFETAQSLESSPYVVKVIDFGETPEVGGAGKSWFMTMEYLQGRELGALIRSSGPVPAARAIRLFCQFAVGLDDAHSFGVIHRDLKPDNIFLCDSPDGDVVRILDFGSVKLQMETGPKLTAFGTTLGSPYYMSPEQAMGKLDVDQRTDVFAAGAILYETLCGKIAFEGAAVAQILMKIVNEMPAPLSTQAPFVGGKPSVPVALDDVIEKALAKNKAHRYGGTVDLALAALGAFGLPVEPGRPGVEKWASTPLASIEAALSGAQPPPPKPFGAPDVSPTPGGAVTSDAGASGPSDPPPGLPGRSPLPLMIGLGVGVALFGLCGLMSVAWWLFF